MRIERLFNLKLINLEDKKTLLREYIELSEKIIKFELEQFSGEIPQEEKLDGELYLREK